MNGRIPALLILGAALVAGVGVWYAQEYGFYYEIEEDSPAALDIVIQTTQGAAHFPAAYNKSIDATSSPLRWRACMERTGPLPADAIPYTNPTPLIGPGWFSCFDAGRIAADLASGAAKAYLSQPEIRPDVDRVIAVYPDGRAFGWHQFNDKTPERGVMD
ncbi:DUF6446 family protein [Paracoccus sp. NGMCC 1.201697]|uniref:DUF6446 family protein n=1 Tax=Paracoccus broussonetiae subsp. drimophilus TaxID=3373869 RepID=A0ABW7LN16_9RHOB